MSSPRSRSADCGCAVAKLYRAEAEIEHVRMTEISDAQWQNWTAALCLTISRREAESQDSEDEVESLEH